MNLGLEAESVINNIPLEFVHEIHLAGYADVGNVNSRSPKGGSYFKQGKESGSVNILLEDWQNRFSRALEDTEADQQFSVLLDSSTQIGADSGIQIYRNDTISSRINTLRQIYPVCEALLGSDCFQAMGKDYVLQTPSKQPDLNQYGIAFPAFVTSVIGQQDAFGNMPWLADLCQVEWLVHHSYSQEDDPVLDLGVLESPDIEQLVPRLSHSLGFFQTNWSVHEIWEAHQQAF